VRPLPDLAPLAFDALLVDLDGVVWIGGQPLPGAIEALEGLRADGVPVVFVTNDPASSPARHAARLTRLGHAVAGDAVVTSASATATVIGRRHPGARAFVLGPEALRTHLTEVGCDVRADESGREAEVVAIGGTKHLTFDDLRRATQAVLAGARLYATNRDPLFPMPDGPWPATGALVAAVETATGVTATAIGKPEPWLFELATARVRAALDGRLAGRDARIAVVGDRRDSDIAGGRRAGLTTVLVGDGDGDGPAPDHHLGSLADVVAARRG
jgi:glycerol-1-phosphatase